LSYRTTFGHTCANRAVILESSQSVEVETTIAVEPASVEPLAGWAMVREGKLEEAVQGFEEVADASAESGLPHVGRAVALGMLGRDAEAIAAMRKGVELDPEALRYVPADEHMKSILGHLSETYRKQTAGAEAPLDLWFMVAAIEAARADYPAAFAAIENADRLGDTEASTVALRRYIADEQG
jgi:tetratricopeptide (TPR) repeat protein